MHVNENRPHQGPERSYAEKIWPGRKEAYPLYGPERYYAETNEP